MYLSKKFDHFSKNLVDSSVDNSITQLNKISEEKFIRIWKTVLGNQIGNSPGLIALFWVSKHGQ